MFIIPLARANRELVVYGLYLAGGATDRIHTEDVALKCWELFPDSFSWTKYPQYPDKDIVRVTLTDARKDQYGALVSGRVEGHASGAGRAEPEGWILTENGLAWIKDNMHLFGNDTANYERKAHRQLILRRVKELKTRPRILTIAARERDPPPRPRRFVESRFVTAFSPSIGELAA